MNAKKEIFKIVNKEDIIAISIGDFGWGEDVQGKGFYGKGDIDNALDILDFEFDSGYGGEEGYRIYVWTKDKIIFKSVYDGAEGYNVIPRNPNKKEVPDAFGG